MLPSIGLITTSFATIRADDINNEKRWYPSYTTLLALCFPNSDLEPYLTTYNYGGLKIGANTEVLLDHCKGINIATLYMVNGISLPIFFIEIKPPGHLEAISTRAAADMQMRARFTMIEQVYRGSEMEHLLHTTIIYGISAMGTRFTVYSYHQREVTPGRLWSKFPKRIKGNVAPAENWKFDLLDGAGQAELECLVNQTKGMVNQVLRPLQQPLQLAQKINELREKMAQYAHVGRKRSYDDGDVSPNGQHNHER